MTITLKRLALAISAPAAVAAAFAVGSPATGQSPPGRTLTFTELDKGATFVHIRNTKTRSRKANSQGDVLTFTNPLADTAGKTVGKLHAACTTTVGSRDFTKSTMTCHGVIVLPDGTLTGLGNITPGAATNVTAVTGGTGAYSGARGQLTSRATDAGMVDTITLDG
jgi:hypothetical protein